MVKILNIASLVLSAATLVVSAAALVVSAAALVNVAGLTLPGHSADEQAAEAEAAAAEFFAGDITAERCPEPGWVSVTVRDGDQLTDRDDLRSATCTFSDDDGNPRYVVYGGVVPVAADDTGSWAESMRITAQQGGIADPLAP